MAALLYDFIFIVFAIIYFPYVLLKGKWHKGFGMRLGKIPSGLVQIFAQEKNIWIHAVSVGEVLVVTGLIDQIKEQYPQHRIVLSTVTKTGYDLARTKMKDKDLVIFAPLDLSWVVRKYTRVINPQMYITAETEIWPNLFLALAQRNIPLIQINGRISDGAYVRYKWVRFLLRRVLKCVTVFCMQSPLDAKRIVELGASEERVRVVGNVKFDDIVDSNQTDDSSLGFRGFRQDEIVWIAGSTHPGEEVLVLRIYQKLKKEFNNLRLVIAPRHVERTPAVEQIIREMTLTPVRFSELKTESASIQNDAVVVVDTIGHLRSLYKGADVVFVGKSFAVGGGQNIIEPAFYGKPVLVGPAMQNFKKIMEIFLEAEGIIQIQNEAEFLEAMCALLKSPQQRSTLGSKAQAVIRQNQGATHKTQEIISQVISID